MVCVLVSRSGYDFDLAQKGLEELSTRLDAATLAQMRTALSSWTPPKSLEALQSRLASTIPAIISVCYDPEGTNNALAATARDIRDKVRLLQTGRRFLRRDGSGSRGGIFAVEASLPLRRAFKRASRSRLRVPALQATPPASATLAQAEEVEDSL